MNLYVSFSTLSTDVTCSVKMTKAMMTSSNGKIFRVTDHLCGEFTAHRWIPPTQGQWGGALMFSLICAWINSWVNNREAGDLRRHRSHYDVIVMAMRASQFLTLWLTRITPAHRLSLLHALWNCCILGLINQDKYSASCCFVSIYIMLWRKIFARYCSPHTGT